MVQSNYTVSTAHQLLGRLLTVRVSGSKSKSTSAADHAGEHAKVVERPSRGIAPTKPLPPTPLNTIRTDFPAVVTEGEILKLPAAVYTPTTPTPTTPRAKSRNVNLASTDNSRTRVPVIDTPRNGRSSPELQKRISQYYEYITPPISLTIGRTDSRRERKASHTPTSSAGSEIYFSPIDATSSQVFLSSPQPSPPISPSDPLTKDDEQAKLGEVVVKKVAELAFDTALAKEPEMVEIAGVGRSIDGSKVTLTLAHVDRVTTALARAPLVQMRVRGSHLDALPEKMMSLTTDHAPDNNSDKNTTNSTGLPTPPPSEASTTDSTGGIALLNTTINGAPISLASTDAFTPGRCTHLSLPYGLSTTSNLRIEPAQSAHAESKIILQSLFATFDRKTHARANFTLLAETDVTPSFARAALTELAAAQNLTLDDIEIRTPTAPYSPDGESIDWCAIGQEEEVRSPTSDILHDTLMAFASSPSSTNAAPLSAETCTMQTLTLLSELSRLQTAHATFLILQPTRFDAQGALAGVKIPLVSRKLQERFEKMGGVPSSSSTSSSSAASSTSSHGGLRGRLFREAVIAAVAPRLAFGEEFEMFIGLGKGQGRVRARCVPIFGGEGLVERWVCFLGGEFDVPY
ncbi:hypothetical protein MBLNU13_g03224t1 [Cladosporium sp. NU13]